MNTNYAPHSHNIIEATKANAKKEDPNTTTHKIYSKSINYFLITTTAQANLNAKQNNKGTIMPFNEPYEGWDDWCHSNPNDDWDHEDRLFDDDNKYHDDDDDDDD